MKDGGDGEGDGDGVVIDNKCMKLHMPPIVHTNEDTNL